MDIAVSSGNSVQFDFSGRTVFVTGASRGIGRQIVSRFAAAGAAVAFCARNAMAVAELEAEVRSGGKRALGVVADISNPADVERFVDIARGAFGSPDVLINNTGIAGPTKAVDELSLEEWNEQLAVNLTGTFLMIRAVVPEMKRKGRGAILSVGSVTGKRPLANRLGYAASKMGLLGLTRTLAEELGPFGITVNQVSPGAVAGTRLEEVLSAQSAAEGTAIADLYRKHAASSPLQQLVQEDDVVAALLFLASDVARRMTGQDINVSAGSVMY